MTEVNSLIDADVAALVEEAEAAAAEAEALADAARARAQAIRLQQQGGATEPAEAEEPEAESSSAAGARRWRRPGRRTVLFGIALLCVAVQLGLAVVMMRHHREAMHEQQLAGEFAAAARQVVVTLMSIDAANAKDDAQRIIDSSTGPFRDEFQNAAEAFVKTAQQAKVSTTTTVQDAAVDSMTDDTAVVLVAARSTVTNAAGAKEEPRTWRLSVHLVRDDGQLKMSTMEFIP